MGVRISAMADSDKAWYHDIIRRCIADAGLELIVREVARDSLDRVEAVATNAEDVEDRGRAIRVLRAIAEDGASGQVGVVLKEERTVVVLNWHGEDQEFTIPARVAVRDPQSRAWQHHFYDDLPRETYVRWVRGLRRTTDRQAMKLTVHEQNVVLLNAYPAAKTVGEAKELAGETFEQGELAV